MHNILEQILSATKKDLIIKKEKLPFDVLLGQVDRKKGENEFKKSLTRLPAEEVFVIAEVKLASPRQGQLGKRVEILERVAQYETGGADAISYITQAHYFNGVVSDIRKIKKKVAIPVLQKDFVIDTYQIYQAALMGSDALLLIAKIVEEEFLCMFVEVCLSLNIEPIVEVSDQEDLEKALKTNASIIAVNARDLTSFSVDVHRACRLIQKIPKRYTILGFSGIMNRTQVNEYITAGARGILVGTSLMKSPDIQAFLQNLKTQV